MKNMNDPERIAARLTNSVSSQENSEDRSNTLAKFISGYESDIIGPVLGSIVANSARRMEDGLTFLSLFNIPPLKKIIPDWDWAGLENWFARTKLEEAWNLFNRISAGTQKHIIAKISMLTEVFYLLIEDDLLDPESDIDCTGANIALTVLKGIGKENLTFRIQLSSYPVGIRKFLKDILAELDFIENTPGTWQFTMSPKSLEYYYSGRNLLSHMGAGMMSQAVAQRNAENLVKRLELLIKALQMFPAGHPSIDPSTESFLSILSKFFKEKENVTLTVMGDTVMINDLRVERGSPGMIAFIRSFVERNMSSLTFEPGVTAENVKTFARIFNRPAVYISEHGGIDRLLELKGLDSISINRFHYKLISEDGDSEQTLARGEVTIEDAIFSELIDRLERGESIDSLPGSKIGDALKSVLTAAKDNREEQRGMIARFVTALDPTLLERGLLSNRIIQRGMAWKAIRKIIDRLLANLSSPDPDTRHQAVSKLNDMALLAVERGKENSTLQIIENISRLLKREQDPDVLYKGIILVATLMEALLARGMMSIALEAGKILMNFESMQFSRTELEAARKRSLAEAKRKMDTLDAATTLVQKILSEDETVSKEARRLALIAPQDNLVSQLVNIFHEDSRRLRSKAFRMLLEMGSRGLSAIHRKLTETVEAFNSHKSGAAFSLPETEWYKARNMVQVLRDIGSPSSENILAELCKVPDSRIRRECILALVKVSSTTAESLSMSLIMDKSKEVAEIALNILTKRALSNPAFIPRITDAYRKNQNIRPEIMESFSILGNNRIVIDFITGCLKKGPSGLLCDNTDLMKGALRVIRRYGGKNELPVLETLLDKAKGGFFKKNKFEKSLVQELKDTIRNLNFSESILEGDSSLEPSSTVKTARTVKHHDGDDEITILGSDYGINN